jgi:hypothetical protein
MTASVRVIIRVIHTDNFRVWEDAVIVETHNCGVRMDFVQITTVGQWFLIYRCSWLTILKDRYYSYFISTFC